MRILVKTEFREIPDIKARIQAAIAEEQKIGFKACVHEIGHLHYFMCLAKYLGYSDMRGFKFNEPVVTFDGLKVLISEPSISTPFEKETLDYSDTILFLLAKGAEAGDMFAQELAWKGSYTGQFDRDVYHEYYDIAANGKRPPRFLEKQFLRFARVRILKDLRSKQLRRDMQFVARRYVEEYYFKINS